MHYTFGVMVFLGCINVLILNKNNFMAWRVLTCAGEISVTKGVLK